MYKHILLPTDGSELSERAVKLGIAFAKSLDAKVTGLFAKPSVAMALSAHSYSRDSHAALKQLDACEVQLNETAGRIASSVSKLAEEAGVACEVVCIASDRPADAIIEAATSKACDLVFMASHGRRGIEGLLLGSETTKVLTHSKIPVLIVR